MKTVIKVSDEKHLCRFDRVLEDALPGTGLRYRRRLIESGQALLDGVRRKPGFKVRTGQEITLTLESEGCPDELKGLLRIVERTSDYAALFKPGGPHSAAVSGSPEPAVEHCLEKLLPSSGARLVNRLDRLTSGLLIVAFSKEAEDRFREYEDGGKVRKYYLARVTGIFEKETVVRAELNTDSRSVTRIAGNSNDPLRHSRVTPLEVYEDGTSLVRVCIAKGARHQIRVHLASCGHPIVGDPLYGSGEGQVMYLHHERIELPAFTAEAAPEWKL